MDARLAALQALWEEKRGHRALPERRDFMAEEFRPWFGHICMVKVEEPAARFRVTLAGLEVVRYYGRDLTGSYLDNEMSSEGFDWVVETYRECASAAEPRFFKVPPLGYRGTAMPLSRLMLPCGAEGTVSHIIVGIYPAE